MTDEPRYQEVRFQVLMTDEQRREWVTSTIDPPLVNMIGYEVVPDEPVGLMDDVGSLAPPILGLLGWVLTIDSRMPQINVSEYVKTELDQIKDDEEHTNP